MVVNQGGERDSEEESQTMAMKLAKEIISDEKDSDDKNRKRKRSVMAVSILAFSVQSAFAYTVNVNSSIPITQQVMPALGTINTMLGNIRPR